MKGAAPKPTPTKPIASENNVMNATGINRIQRTIVPGFFMA